jgi:hypothetical protein
MDDFVSAALSAASTFFQCGVVQPLHMPMEQQHAIPQPSLVAAPAPMQIDAQNDASTKSGDGSSSAAKQMAMHVDAPAASSSGSPLTFDSLPADVTEKIFAHLAPADLKYARIVSR